MSTKVLVISGSMGSGKTTVLGESSDVLTSKGIAHAALDLDAIHVALVPTDASHQIRQRSLRALYEAIVRARVGHILIAEAIESLQTIERLRQAMHGAEICVCRLTAALATMQARLRIREPGMLQPQFLARAAELDRLLDAAGLEDFTVVNDGRPVTEVAWEVLRLAGWIEPDLTGGRGA